MGLLKFWTKKSEEPKKRNMAQIWKPRPIDVEKFFPDDEIIVSKTDTRGNITYGNKLFIRMSGYTEDELLFQPHNIIRHPDMPQIIFKALWDTISQGKEINAYVVNLAKDGKFYWVFANVTPSFDRDHNIIGYHSVRRKPNPKAIGIIKPFYKTLLEAEAVGGVHESTKELVKLLEAHKMSYEELILFLQYKI
jgi:PAS domain S-box-containing protein